MATVLETEMKIRWQKSGLLKVLVLFGVSILLTPPANVAGAAGLWSAVQAGDHVILLRHALAPGTGDPAGFSVSDCSTQRNLSVAGREQARRIGELFRANGIEAARVYSSQWCRCLETARLLELGRVTELPILNSFFREFHREKPQTRQLTKWLRQQDLSQPLVLVTHQVNITALTGIFPRSGELVVVRREGEGRFRVSGTLETD